MGVFLGLHTYFFPPLEHCVIRIDEVWDKLYLKPVPDSLLDLSFAMNKEGHKSLKRLRFPKFGDYDFVITSNLTSSHNHFHPSNNSLSSTSLRLWFRRLLRTARLVSTHQRDPVHLGHGTGFHQPCAD